MTPGERACNELKVSLKEYFEIQLNGIRESAAVASIAFERRIKELNEVRGQVLADRALFTTRDLHDRLQSDVSNMATELSSLKTRLVTWVAGMGLFNTLLIAVMAYHFLQSK